jgi:hypothetical protein
MGQSQRERLSKKVTPTVKNILLAWVALTMSVTGFAQSAPADPLQKYNGVTVVNVNKPGELETAILNGAVPILSRDFGELPGPGVARFTAVVVRTGSAGGSSLSVLKGMRVELEGIDRFNNNIDRHDTVYIDESSLEFLLARLELGLRLQPRGIPGVGGMAINRSPADGKYYLPLTVGEYLHDPNVPGKYYKPRLINPYDPNFPGFRFASVGNTTRGPGHHGGVQFRMPNANIEQVITILRTAREWLQANPPTADLAKIDQLPR